MPESAMSERRALAHLPALDGLRGVAIAAVMVYHFVWYQLTFGTLKATDFGGRSAAIVLEVLLTGWAGVDLFFVLSGFLITRILLQTRGQGGYFKVFYARRFLRIFPAYYLWLGVVTALTVVLLPKGHARADSLYPAWLFTYLSNVLISLRGWNSVPLPLQHFWSLAIEEQFYLAWPLLVWALDRRKAVAACLALMGAALALRLWLLSAGQPNAAHLLAPARMDSLVGGALLAFVSQDEALWRRLRRRAAPLAIGSVLLLLALYVVREEAIFSLPAAFDDPWVATIGCTLFTLGAMGWIAVSADPGAGRHPWVSHPALQFLGRYSYGLYLVHQPLVSLLWSRGIPKGGAQLLTPWMPTALAVFLMSVVMPMALSVVVALVSWHLVEKHFLRLKDRFPYGAPADRFAPIATS